MIQYILFNTDNQQYYTGEYWENTVWSREPLDAHVFTSIDDVVGYLEKARDEEDDELWQVRDKIQGVTFEVKMII